MDNTPITLGLRAAPARDGAATLVPVLDRLVGLVCSAIEPVLELSPDRSLARAIAGRRDALRAARDPGHIIEAAEQLVELCGRGVVSLERQRTEARAEIVSLLSLLQDAVATIADAGSGISAEVTTSVGRFDALHDITDIAQLKSRLAAEVGHLREMVAERERRWSSTVSSFEGRIAVLERQLADTLEVATHDALTGVANRRAFDAAVAAALANRQHDTVLAIVDVDDFKSINDTSGHAAGDEVLMAVARALGAAVRSDDMVGRLGGDEFALLLRGLTLPRAESRLRDVVGRFAAQPFVLNGSERGVTLSGGVAEYSAGDTAATLLRRADQALYAAKRAGKGRVMGSRMPLIRELMER